MYVAIAVRSSSNIRNYLQRHVSTNYRRIVTTFVQDKCLTWSTNGRWVADLSTGFNRSTNRIWVTLQIYRPIREDFMLLLYQGLLLVQPIWDVLRIYWPIREDFMILLYQGFLLVQPIGDELRIYWPIREDFMILLHQGVLLL